MAVWKLARLGTVSSLTGKAFPPSSEVVTALFGQEEEISGEDKVRGSGFTRRDYLAEEATPEHLAGAFCVWRTRTPEAKPDAEKRLDLGMAREFLTRLLKEVPPEGPREDRAPVCLALALLLLRKRRLHLVAERDGALEVRWPREEETFRVPAPVLTEADAERLQQDLLKLFEL